MSHSSHRLPSNIFDIHDFQGALKSVCDQKIIGEGEGNENGGLRKPNDDDDGTGVKEVDNAQDKEIDDRRGGESSETNILDTPVDIEKLRHIVLQQREAAREELAQTLEGTLAAVKCQIEESNDGENGAKDRADEAGSSAYSRIVEVLRRMEVEAKRVPLENKTKAAEIRAILDQEAEQVRTINRNEFILEVVRGIRQVRVLMEEEEESWTKVSDMSAATKTVVDSQRIVSQLRKGYCNLRRKERVDGKQEESSDDEDVGQSVQFPAILLNATRYVEKRRTKRTRYMRRVIARSIGSHNSCLEARSHVTTHMDEEREEELSDRIITILNSQEEEGDSATYRGLLDSLPGVSYSPSDFSIALRCLFDINPSECSEAVSEMWARISPVAADVVKTGFAPSANHASNRPLFHIDCTPAGKMPGLGSCAYFICHHDSSSEESVSRVLNGNEGSLHGTTAQKCTDELNTIRICLNALMELLKFLLQILLRDVFLVNLGKDDCYASFKAFVGSALLEHVNAFVISSVLTPAVPFTFSEDWPLDQFSEIVCKFENDVHKLLLGGEHSMEDEITDGDAHTSLRPLGVFVDEMGIHFFERMGNTLFNLARKLGLSSEFDTIRIENAVRNDIITKLQSKHCLPAFPECEILTSTHQLLATVTDIMATSRVSLYPHVLQAFATYCELLLFTHGEKLRSTPALTMALYCSLMYISHVSLAISACLQYDYDLESKSSAKSFLQFAKCMNDTASAELQSHLNEQKAQLATQIRESGGMSGSDSNAGRERIQLLLKRVFYGTETLLRLWKGILPQSMYLMCSAKILDSLCNAIVHEISQLDSIGEDESNGMTVGIIVLILCVLKLVTCLFGSF